MDAGRSIRQLTDDELVAKRTEAINMCKGEKWYKLFLIAKAMDKKLVSPPEPDPSDCSIAKREWNHILFKWKYDTKALVRFNPLYAPGPIFTLPRNQSSMPLYASRHTLEAHKKKTNTDTR